MADGSGASPSASLRRGSSDAVRLVTLIELGRAGDVTAAFAAEDYNSAISFAGLLRTGVAEDDDLDHVYAMWQAIYGSLDPAGLTISIEPDGSARSPDLEAYTRRMVLLVGGAAALAVQLARFVAVQQGLSLSEVLDKTERHLVTRTQEEER